MATIGAMRWFLISLALAGCASAGKGNSIIGGITDAGGDRDSDAARLPVDARADAAIDAPPVQITLTEVNDPAITDGNSIACKNTAGATRQTSYFRVFPLMLDAMLHVTEVDFGVEAAAAGAPATSQPVQVRIGLYEGALDGTTLDPSVIVPIGDAVDLDIPDGTGTTVAVPITGDVAARQNLIVELAVPDGAATGSSFFIGSSAQGEAQPGYFSAPDCGIANPTTLDSITAQLSHGPVDILISVIGTQ